MQKEKRFKRRLSNVQEPLFCNYRENFLQLSRKATTNDSTIRALRKLKSDDGQYLWQPAVKDDAPDTLLGKPVYTSQFVPVIAEGASVMAFGDFSYYWIGDRQSRTFKRLDQLFAVTGQVGFLATERVDGKLILPEAVRILKMGTK